jgi:hypothetical protein
MRAAIALLSKQIAKIVLVASAFWILAILLAGAIGMCIGAEPICIGARARCICDGMGNCHWECVR